MELDNNEIFKSVKIIHFNELKKMKFDKFEVYLGFEKPPYYSIKEEREYNHKLIKKDDYDKYDLISRKRLDIKELLNYSDCNSIEELVEKNINTEELYHEIYKLVRLYIENDLLQKEQDIKLGDFQITYIINGVITKLKVSSKKKREIILGKFINYFFWIYILSLIISFFISIEISGIILIIPAILYAIWAYYSIYKELRDGENYFKFYLLKLPFYFFILGIIGCWYFIPFYFFYKSSFYFLLMKFIGGVVGEVVWFFSYIFIMYYFGKKLLRYLDILQEKIKSIF
jgi:hypothetical protein